MGIAENSDEYWMRRAISMAKQAQKIGEVPVGAVIIHNEKCIASAHNEPISTNDPSAHAEIQALRKAAAKIHNYRLLATTLYVTLEPCAMCLGAMVHARIFRIVFGAEDPKSGVLGSCCDLLKKPCFNHQPKITGGVLAADCQHLLQDFFHARRLEFSTDD